MKRFPGFYSIVQYCHDSARSEAANIGVVLFCPELKFLKVKLSVGNARIRKFFGSSEIDIERLNLTKESLKARLEEENKSIETLQDLEYFINTRANELVLTQPRAVKVENGYSDLDSLFDELVGGSHRAQVHSDVRKIWNDLLGMIRMPLLENRIKFGESVQIPNLNKVLTSDFAYQNGSLNLVKKQSFYVDDRYRVNARNLASDGYLLSKAKDNKGASRLIVVPLFDNTMNSKVYRSEILRIFEDFSVRTVTQEHFSEFAKEIEEQAH